jgi:hypothetical protein
MPSTQENFNSSNWPSSSELLDLTASQLESLIAAHPAGSSEEAQSVLRPKPFDEKEYDRERKKQQRASGREVYIPVPEDIPLRLACLQDPELLLTTCFPMTYSEPFTDDRKDMLRSIWRAAKYGGDQAIAASRGEGKTTLAMDGALCLMLAGLSFFPVIIGKNQDASSDELKATRERIMASDEFVALFPEIGAPLQAVGPQAGNARLQTVGGQFIGMYLGPKHFAFPKITNEMLPHWPADLISVAAGQVMGAVGIEGRVRGFKFRSHRPSVAVIDDVESKDSAVSDLQIEKIERTIEEDIGGMGSSAERIARVYLCTTLNRRCNAYRYTCRKTKPSWNGRRYRKMIKRPERMDLVEEYIALRKARGDDDPDARVAFRYWRDNLPEIERDCKISNPHSYSRKQHEDGEPIELSAIQAYFNRVADMGEKAVATEIDNDPPDESGVETLGLTAGKVASRISGYLQGDLHPDTQFVTVGLDIGKYYSHWAKIAWHGNAIGHVVDYGVMETPGMTTATDARSVMTALLPALMQFRTDMIADGKLDFCLVDSGDYSEAIYEFVRQAGGHPFAAAKGHPGGKLRIGDVTPDRRPFLAAFAHRLPQERLWLYNLDSEFWKQWVHDRFATATFDENEMLNDGSLSIYAAPDDRKRHLSYSHHIVAEERRDTFVAGKGIVRKWVTMSKNNHYLDATALACAAAGCLGVSLVPKMESRPPATQSQPRRQRPAITNPSGKPFLATER